MSKQGLTGRRRYRHGFFGRLILQVEVQHYRETFEPPGWIEEHNWTTWRDARVEDLPELKP